MQRPYTITARLNGELILTFSEDTDSPRAGKSFVLPEWVSEAIELQDAFHNDFRREQVRNAKEQALKAQAETHAREIAEIQKRVLRIRMDASALADYLEGEHA